MLATSQISEQSFKIPFVVSITLSISFGLFILLIVICVWRLSKLLPVPNEAKLDSKGLMDWLDNNREGGDREYTFQLGGEEDAASCKIKVVNRSESSKLYSKLLAEQLDGLSLVLNSATAQVKPAMAILYGPPGTGKSEAVRRYAVKVAQSLNKDQCPPVVIEVSTHHLSIGKKFVGAGERVMDSLEELIGTLTKSQRSVYLILDEIDAIGKRSDGQVDIESTSATINVNGPINRFLCMLDGIKNKEGVFVFATTNYVDVDHLDDAIIRDGRSQCIKVDELTDGEVEEAVRDCLTQAVSNNPGRKFETNEVLKHWMQYAQDNTCMRRISGIVPVLGYMAIELQSKCSLEAYKDAITRHVEGLKEKYRQGNGDISACVDDIGETSNESSVVRSMLDGLLNATALKGVVRTCVEDVLDERGCVCVTNLSQ